MKAPSHPEQPRRLRALQRYDILDTPVESDFDDIVKLASEICQTPVSVINFIDAERQWFKAEVGLGVRETPLETSICSHVILEDDFVEIPDTLRDRRMRDNPLCTSQPGFRFYAGALLQSEEGLPLGTLCVLDHQPRSLTSVQRHALRVLAAQVMKQLELRHALKQQAILRREIDHRVTNSLTTISSLIQLQRHKSDTPGLHAALQAVENRIRAIAVLHRELCQSESVESVDLRHFMQRIEGLLRQSAATHIRLDIDVDPVATTTSQASSIGVITNEFVTNSFAHAFPNQRAGHIEIRGYRDDDGLFTLRCRDDGIGSGDQTASGSGLGLMIIRASASQLGGECQWLDKDREGFALTVRFPLQEIALPATPGTIRQAAAHPHGAAWEQGRA